MANLNTTQIAHLNTTQIARDLLGPSQRVYHQVLASDTLQPRLKIDKLGAGDFIFVDSVPAGQNPAHSLEQKGLLTSVERSLTAPDRQGQGHLAAVKAANIHMPRRFVLTATFIEPKKVSLIPNQRPPQGTFAAALLLSFGRTSSAGATNLRGASCQFRAPGVRLNATGIGVARPEIDVKLVNKIIDPQNPSLFTLVLHLVRSPTNSEGDAKLFVGTEAADSFHFTLGNDLTSSTVFDSIRIGITTFDGTNYKASVFLTQFEIWAPIPATPNKSLDASGGGVLHN